MAESVSLAFEDVGMCGDKIALREEGRWFVLVPFKQYRDLLRRAEGDNSLILPITTRRLEQTIAVS